MPRLPTGCDQGELAPVLTILPAGCCNFSIGGLSPPRLETTDPMELAAGARIAIETAGSAGAPRVVDLLE